MAYHKINEENEGSYLQEIIFFFLPKKQEIIIFRRGL